MIVEFLKYHAAKPMADIDKPLKSAKMSEVVADPWDADFIDLKPQGTTTTITITTITITTITTTILLN